jgi:hypothetical protein
MAWKRPPPYRIPKSARWLVKEAPPGTPLLNAAVAIVHGLKPKDRNTEHAWRLRRKDARLPFELKVRIALELARSS